MLVTRWQSRNGRRWLELHKDELGYFFRADNCGGSLGSMSEEEALRSCGEFVQMCKEVDRITLRRVV